MKYVVTVLLFVWTTQALAITAELNKTNVAIDETFKLILTEKNNPNNELPDFSPLQTDFNIMGTEKSMRYTLTNGKASAFTRWTIHLSAKKEGQLTIPPITIGQQSTPALTINVSASPSSSNTSLQKQPNQAVRLSTQVSTQKPYVNQQIIYTVKLYTRYQIIDAAYQEPKVKDALIISLGSTTQSQTIINGHAYAVSEQRYAIFPQKSGLLKITSPVFKAIAGDIIPKRINVRGKDIELNVKPIPKDYQAQHWLPAKKITLSDNYKEEKKTFRQGDTLIRTITIESVGIPAQLLPKIVLEKSGDFNVYPEKSKEDNRIQQQQLLGTSITQITYLFNKSGEITIPEFQLPWFNTDTGKEDVAVLPSRTLTILPALNQKQNTLSAPQQPLQTKNSQTTASADSDAFTPKKYIAWFLVLFFAVAWLIILGLWLRQKYRRKKSKEAPGKKINKLQLACQNNNAENAHLALLDWGKQQWPEANILNLGDLAQLIRHSELKTQINLLSKALYGHNKDIQWQGDALWSAVISYKKIKSSKKHRTNPLPPINPR